MIRCWAATIFFLALATGFELVAYVNTKVDGFSWQQLPWSDVTTVINIKGDAMDLVKTAQTLPDTLALRFLGELTPTNPAAQIPASTAHRIPTR